MDFPQMNWGLRWLSPWSSTTWKRVMRVRMEISGSSSLPTRCMALSSSELSVFCLLIPLGLSSLFYWDIPPLLLSTVEIMSPLSSLDCWILELIKTCVLTIVLVSVMCCGTSATTIHSLYAMSLWCEHLNCYPCNVDFVC